MHRKTFSPGQWAERLSRVLNQPTSYKKNTTAFWRELSLPTQLIKQYRQRCGFGSSQICRWKTHTHTHTHKTHKPWLRVKIASHPSRVSSLFPFINNNTGKSPQYSRDLCRHDYFPFSRKTVLWDWKKGTVISYL